jgi:aspartate/methionine/tyrosine aminotransferase
LNLEKYSKEEARAIVLFSFLYNQRMFSRLVFVPGFTFLVGCFDEREKGRILIGLARARHDIRRYTVYGLRLFGLDCFILMFFESFAVERWMDKYEKSALYDLAETCSLSISLKALLQWSKEDGEPALEEAEAFQKVGYGHICGAPKLRNNIAALYSKDSGITSDCIITTQGAIGANFLTLVTLVGKGDHVICVSPTYQQLQQLPKTFGADVSLWNLHPDKEWKHEVEELQKLVTPKTSLVIINNPNNPTGAVIPTSTLRQICQTVESIAPKAIILCDEVYRPLFHSLPAGEDPPSSILELGFSNVIATGSLSKAYSLAGLRVGWIATPRKDLLERFLGVRDYNVISVSGVDEELAARALGTHAKAHIMERNINLARTNRHILSDWIAATPGTRWVPTTAGTTALVYLGDGVHDEHFCAQLCESKGVVSLMRILMSLIFKRPLTEIYYRTSYLLVFVLDGQDG